MTQILGTPLEIALWYVPTDGPVTPSVHPLEQSSGQLTFLGDVVLGLLPQDQQTQKTAKAALATPFDQIFAQEWAGLLKQGTPQQAVQQVIKSARSNAYDISAAFPSSGTLQAQVATLASLSAELFGLPSSWAGQLLELRYSLASPVAISWKESTHTVFGSYADPSLKVTFDGTLEVLVAVSADPTFGLVPQASFQAANIHGGPDGISLGNLVFLAGFLLETAWDFFTFQPVPSLNMPDQNASVASTGLQQSFNLLSQGFALAAAQGFKQLGVQISGNSQPIPGRPRRQVR
jgi:hypothetical protein